jgi:large subunit ribosomal protein L25
MKKDIFTLTASKRSDIGKGASRRLRHTSKVPAIVYGVGKTPSSITVDHKEIMYSLANEAFFSHVLTLNIDGTPEKVILKDVQRHPFRPKILHLDFLRISETEKFTMAIPLHFKGGDVAPGVKLSGGLVSHLMTEIEVKCLPKHLPEYLTVDLSNLEVNQGVHLSNIPLPEGVELVDLAHGEDKPVALIYIPRAIVEVEVPKPEAEAAAEGAAAPEKGKEETAEKKPAEKKAGDKGK